MSVDVSVKTVPSIAIEILSAVIVVAIPLLPSTVKVSPKSTAWEPVSPVTVIVELSNFVFGKLANALLGIFVNVLLSPLIVLFVKTEVEASVI